MIKLEEIKLDTSSIEIYHQPYDISESLLNYLQNLFINANFEKIPRHAYRIGPETFSIFHGYAIKTKKDDPEKKPFPQLVCKIPRIILPILEEANSIFRTTSIWSMTGSNDRTTKWVPFSTYNQNLCGTKAMYINVNQGSRKISIKNTKTNEIKSTIIPRNDIAIVDICEEGFEILIDKPNWLTKTRSLIIASSIKENILTIK